MDHATRLQEELHQISQPLLDHYNELNDTVARMEAEIVALRRTRTQLRTVLRSIDPELLPIEHKNSDKKKSVATDKLQELTAWLRERSAELNANGGFHAAGLKKTHTDIPVQSSTLNAALRILHEQGIVRLDSTGMGGAKYYKVVI